MHRRRLLVAVGASALIMLGSLPMTAFAAGPDRVPQRVDMSKIDPVLQPQLADTGRQVNVILELSGQPALRAGVTRSAQQNRASTLRTAQKPVVSAVNRTGSKVTARYQHAYNGLRVRTTMGKLAELAAIPGVVAVHPVRVYERTNVNGAPAIGAPAAWEYEGATGDGVIVAVIDTGIDYTHANFGGEGSEDAFEDNDPDTVEPGTFPTTKVIAGYDLVGDAYNASASGAAAVPVPDDDPLDCNGHGSHVAGSVAGFGVLADESTYDGRYTEDLLDDAADWAIGPGIAPEAKLVGLKVFGCDGSTDVVVDALNWVAQYNVDHAVGIDVVNMSLGSPFGQSSEPDAVMTNNLVAAGVVVVTSAGNESDVPFITGAPGVATSAISVAALDATPTLPMATVETAGEDYDGINQNAWPGLPVSGDLFVVDDGVGGVSLGCEASDFPAGVSGNIAVVKRGVCAFVDKGMYAEDAGAIGIIVVNRDDVGPAELPTFLGYNPEIFDIPMIGLPNTVPGSVPAVSMDDALMAIDGDPVTLASAGTQPNPAYNEITGFSSSGPRWGDNWLKPDVAAPGASVVSTLVGGGWRGTTLSGTSMAAPMTAGAAALVIQAHPGWAPVKVKAALIGTADADTVVDYSPVRSGSGLIQVEAAVTANVVATTGTGTASLSYGYAQAAGAWSASRTITFWNDGTEAASYSLDASTSLVSLSRSVLNIPAGGSASVTATARLSASAVKALPTADQYLTGDFTGLLSMSGAVTATPSGKIKGQHTLRVPYLLVPRGVSNVKADRANKWTRDSGILSGKLTLRNPAGHSGWADVYALGMKDRAGDGLNGMDVRAGGVSVLSALALGVNDDTDRAVTFAVTMHDRWSNPGPHEVDIAIDTDADGDFDRFVIMYDFGILAADAYWGDMVSIITDASFNIIGIWQADAPRNGSTVLLPALASELGLSDGDGSFRYKVFAYDGFTGAEDETIWSKPFDPFNPVISTGKFKEVDAKSSTKVKAWYRRSAEPRGWLVITLDDRNGSYQGDIVRVPR